MLFFRVDKQQEIKDQHFLPQCYLNGFTNPSGLLYTLDLKLFLERGKRPYARASNPAKICKDEHFYTVDENAPIYNLAGVTDKYQVEISFHLYENTFQDLIAKVASGNPLLVNDAAKLVRILIDFKLRNKFYRENMIGARQSKVINETFDEILSSFDNDPQFRAKYPGITREEIAAMNANSRDSLLNDSNFKKNAHLSSMINRGDGYTDLMHYLIPKLMICKWVVLKSNDQFISNDNPGCSIDGDMKIHNTYFKKNFLFVMPLTSSLCLTISDEGQDELFLTNPRIKKFPVIEAPSTMINVSNSFAVRNFNKIAYGPDKNLLDELAQSLTMTKPA